jgi:hypothetical protein
LFDPGDVQKDSNPLAGTEEQEKNAMPTPLLLYLLAAEAAIFLDESE